MARGRRRQDHPGSIRNLLFLLLLAALVPVLLVQAAIYYQEFRAAREDEFLSNLEVARAAAGLFESYLRDVHREETAVGEALLQSPSLPPARANRFLTNVDKQYPAIAALSWIDPQGRVLASSIPKLVGQDWAAADWFHSAKAGQDAVVTNVTRSSQPGEGVFTIASAVRDDEGVPRGVVAAAIDPDKLTDRLKIDRARSGAFSLIDKSGWLVYRYPPVHMTLEQRESGKLYAPVHQALAGREGFSENLCHLRVTGSLHLYHPDQVHRLGGGGRETIGPGYCSDPSADHQERDRHHRGRPLGLSPGFRHCQRDCAEDPAAE